MATENIYIKKHLSLWNSPWRTTESKIANNIGNLRFWEWNPTRKKKTIQMHISILRYHFDVVNFVCSKLIFIELSRHELSCLSTMHRSNQCDWTGVESNTKIVTKRCHYKNETRWLIAEKKESRRKTWTF